MTGASDRTIKETISAVGFTRPTINHAYPLGRTRVFGIYCSAFRVLQLIIEVALLYTVFFVSCNSVAAQQYFNTHLEIGPLNLSLLLSTTLVVCLCCMGLYSSRQSVLALDLLRRLSTAFFFSIVLFFTAYLAMGWQFAMVQIIAAPAVVAFLLLYLGRLLTMNLLARDKLLKKVLILGDGEKADQVFDKLYSHSGSAYSLHRLTMPSATGAVQSGQEILDYVSRHGIDEIVLACQDKRQNLPFSDLLECKLSGITIRNPVEFLERESGLIDFDFLELGWIVFSEGFQRDRIGNWTKRALDLIGGIFLLLISSPLFLLAAIAIKYDAKSSGPVFYKQKRVGINGRLFNIWKFRSMYTNAEANGGAQWAVENDTRVTPVGQLLRKYRIDELPQLINVLKGEMSLVGPRPERPEFVSQLSELHILYGERHRVKPGLTGWAQMRFPYTASSNDSIKKLQYDMYYVKNRSLLLDFLILLQTVEVVLFGKGAR